MDALTTIENTRLSELETTIEQGLQTFVEVGNALMEIRDNRLYRAEYGTFEEYCRERWGMARNYANKLIAASEVVMNLGTTVPILPANEAQTRPLAKLTPELQREVWPVVIETAPNGNITANHVQQVVDDYTDQDHPNGYNYKRDNRRSVAADIYTPQGMDACQTPAYALDPLLPYLPASWVIWEPAAGEGLLVEALYDSGYSECQIKHGDILTGQNFFDFEPGTWDCLITNPPYSIQAEWLERCYQLGKPFALLLKVEVVGNSGTQELMQRYGFEILLLDARVDFKMPYKGWDSSAQFGTFWLCWQLLPDQVVFGSIKESKRRFKEAMAIADVN